MKTDEEIKAEAISKNLSIAATEMYLAGYKSCQSSIELEKEKACIEFGQFFHANAIKINGWDVYNCKVFGTSRYTINEIYRMYEKDKNKPF